MGFSGTPRKDLAVTPLAALDPALRGKRAVIIGGTDGIGRAFARRVAAAGADVTVVGRTFRDESTPGIRFEKADLSSMREARRIGAALPGEIDFLILSAGIFSAPQRQETAEGLERDMAVSYLSRLAILEELTRAWRPPRLAAR